MNMTKKQCERMRTIINRVAATPSFLSNNPELHEAYKIWARHNVIPDLQNMLPENERVKFARPAQ